jgi:hypothetical protein
MKPVEKVWVKGGSPLVLQQARASTLARTACPLNPRRPLSTVVIGDSAALFAVLAGVFSVCWFGNSDWLAVNSDQVVIPRYRQVYEWLRAECQADQPGAEGVLRICRVKNKFAMDEGEVVGGYRDLMVCLSYHAANGLAIIGEVQVRSARGAG